MRAWQVHGHGEPAQVLRLVTVDQPEPGPGQLRLRVAAAGIGLPDVLMCRGSYPLTPGLPFTPGQEVTGTVTAVGAGVGLPIGSRVMAVTAFTEGHGGFAEECLAPADSAFPVPDGLDDVAAAGFWIPHLTGWLALVERGRLAPGEYLAVLGAAGGSGIAAVQLGRALGARVVAVVSDEERARFCRGLGAHASVVYRDGPLSAALRQATDGHGPDLVFDPVGGALASDAAAALARGGRLLSVGFASGAWPEITADRFVLGNTSLVGVFAGGYSRAELDDVHTRLTALVADGSLRTAVGPAVDFDSLPQALQRLADRSVIGKLVLGGI
ncbi:MULTISPECIES: NADPH:quinone oxidoreductase family protein [Streptacidiphilus]|uniref:NADPH:quinone oxidoreductase family protein n=1 Tax=Streptacidiphilus cavernicola TaxID=3342716 RepID=A0ABV6UL19_9ACTN|nr:NADPH:quinone oxidoreductase family protein [Streptacidiphilus jeojiense]